MHVCVHNYQNIACVQWAWVLGNITLAHFVVLSGTTVVELEELEVPY